MAKEETLPAVFIEQAKKKSNRTFLICKKDGKWKEVTWKEVAEKVRYMCLGLIAMDMVKGGRVCALSETRPELAYSCLAIVLGGGIFSSIYHTNSPKECAYVINDLGAKIAFVENQEQLDKLKEVNNEIQVLEKIIVFEKYQSDDERVMGLDRLCEMGEKEYVKDGDQKYFTRIYSVKKDDVIEIIYTSETSGPPKGVMETSGGLIRLFNSIKIYHPVSEKDRGISYLPMAHAVELRNGHCSHIYFGIPQIYAESVNTLFQNIIETNPTFLFTTPIFLEKHFNNFQGTIEDSPRWKKKIIQWGIISGYRIQKMRKFSTETTLYPWYLFSFFIAYLVFFRHVRERIGRKLRYIITGGAPPPAEILKFFTAMGLPVYNCYGSSESQGLISISRKGATRIGSAGKLSDGVEVSFAGDGEILVKGWTRCKGYWNNPEATEELFRDGWLHTGDIGYLDEDGFLFITDRKKKIIITSSGKNITPSTIENLMVTSRYISIFVVIGEGRKYLTGILTLNREEIIKYAEKKGITYSDYSELSKNQEIMDLIREEIDERNKDLARIEQIKKFTILAREFKQNDDEVTPTLKVKRRIFNQKYKDMIDVMYMA
ncbi:AMP-dependent synthetase/ligase [Thermodesulfobacteriota bacterium]